MAIINGYNGSVTLPGHAGAEITAFTLDTGPDLLPTNTFGTSYKRFTKGLINLQGTVTCYLARDVAETDPFASGDGALVLTFDTGCTIGFNAILGNTSIQNSAEGVPVATFSFAKSDDDAPTIAWDESAT